MNVMGIGQNLKRHSYSLDSLVSTVTRLWVGKPGFGSWRGEGLSLFASASKPAL